jgi:hypothetical protein
MILTTEVLGSGPKLTVKVGLDLTMLLLAISSSWESTDAEISALLLSISQGST